MMEWQQISAENGKAGETADGGRLGNGSQNIDRQEEEARYPQHSRETIVPRSHDALHKDLKIV